MAGKKVPVIISFEALDKVSGPIKQLAQRFEATKAPINRFQNSIFRLSRASGLTATFGALQTAAKWVAGITVGLAAMGVAAYYAFNRMIGSSINANAKLQEVAERTGISTDALQKWQFAGKMTGATADDVSDSFRMFSRVLSDTRRGVGPLVDLFGKSSPFLADITKAKGTSEAMGVFMDGLARMKDPADFMKVGLAGMGRGSETLLKLAKGGKSARETLFRMKEAIGLVSQADIDAFNAIQDHWTALDDRFETVRSNFLAKLLPAFEKATTAFEAWLQKSNPDIMKLADQIAENLPAALTLLTESLQYVGRAMAFVAKHAGIMKFAFGVIGMAVSNLFKPLEWLIDLITLLDNKLPSMANTFDKIANTKFGKWIGARAGDALGGMFGGPAITPESGANNKPPQEAKVRVIFEDVPKGVRITQETRGWAAGAGALAGYEVGMKMGPGL